MPRERRQPMGLQCDESEIADMELTATSAADDFEERLVALLERCAGSDAAALEDLYQLTSPFLFASLTRMLKRRAVAEEALQDVFVSVWQRAAQFRPERGRAMAWLMSVARYRAIDLMRHERAAPTLVAELPERAAADDEAHSEPAPWLTASGLLERCIALLSEQQRHCLELAYVAGNSHDEIARLTGNPLGTVKSWIRRGLASLKQCLES
jgi:RNA polymerase sigma-70 factor (ECF subfamily)